MWHCIDAVLGLFVCLFVFGDGKTSMSELRLRPQPTVLPNNNESPGPRSMNSDEEGLGSI